MSVERKNLYRNSFEHAHHYTSLRPRWITRLEIENIIFRYYNQKADLFN